MASDEKKISFSAKDSGVSSFMNKVRQDSKRIFDEQLSNAKKLTNETKDQIKFLREYINELQRKNKLENDARRQSIAMRMQYGGEKEQISAREDQGALRGTMAGQSAQITVLKEMLSEMKKGVTPEKRQSIFEEVIKAGLFRDMTQVVGQIPGARTGLEAIPGLMGMGGAGLGAAIGAPFLASGAGAQLGKAAGEFMANAMVRHLTEQSRYLGAVGRVRGISGMSAVEDLSYLGMDLSQSAALRGGLVRATGIRNQGASHLAQIMKAFSISEGDILGYAGGARYGGGTFNISKLLGTAGMGNIANFDRLIQTQTQLTNVIAQSVLSPNANNIAKSIFEFNKVGGPFGIGDPRSLGLMRNINDSIVNPSNPLSQAMNYSILRRRNPNMGVVDLLMQQQMGISNQGMVGDILSEIDRMGGSEEFKILATAQRFGLQGNIAAAKRLFQKRNVMGQMTDQEFKTFSDEEIKAAASANIAPLEVNQAKITNAFVTGMTDGIATVSTTFAKEMAEASKQVAQEFMKVFSLDKFKTPVSRKP